jgi:hypothetical protein
MTLTYRLLSFKVPNLMSVVYLEHWNISCLEIHSTLVLILICSVVNEIYFVISNQHVSCLYNLCC